MKKRRRWGFLLGGLIGLALVATGLVIVFQKDAADSVKGHSSETPAAIGSGKYRVEAELTPAAPKKSSGAQRGTGSLTGVITIGPQPQAVWSLAYQGMTGHVEEAAISYRASGGYSPIVLCAPCTAGSDLVTTFPSREVAEELAQALAGEATVTLATAQNANGEIGASLKVQRV
jgi:uncharacterized membrane protein